MKYNHYKKRTRIYNLRSATGAVRMGTTGSTLTGDGDDAANSAKT